MNPRPTCEEIQVLAPEVALGIASGDERALVLAHARSCSDCRKVMEELSVTADALLLLGPLDDPSSGFESTVLAKMQSAHHRPTRVGSKLAAVALASALLTGVVAFRITSDDRRVATHYREALAVADGKYFGVVPLHAAGGDRAGHLFAYEGHPSWVFLIFATPLEPGRYEAELETPEGRTMSLGTLQVDAGDVTWGRDLPVGLDELGLVRVLDDDGAIAVQATFPTS
jgi:Putative zinc-finger